MEDKKYEKGTFGWLREQAKKDGFGDNIRGWQSWKKEQKREYKWYKELEKILKDILDTLNNKTKEYEKIKSKDLANIYLGELGGLETAFYIVS